MELDEREIAEYAVEHLGLTGEQQPIFRAYLENYGHGISTPDGASDDDVDVEGYVREWLDEFNEDYAGQYASVEEYAESFLDDLGVLAEVPEMLRYHIDLASYARDLVLGGDIWTVDLDFETVHIFTAR